MNSWEKSDSWFVDYWDSLDEFYGVHTIFGRHAEMRDTNEKTVGGSPLMEISWFDKDSDSCNVIVPWHDSDDSEVILGFSDHKLLMNLCKGGTEEAKWRRMIHVSMDITAPLYWWKEFETYKVATVSNSCSTMHKIHAKEFTLDDFSCEHLLDCDDPLESAFDIPLIGVEFTDLYDDSGRIIQTPMDILKHTIEMLNRARELFLKDKDKSNWWQMIQLLPTSYNQKRTIDLNYEVLASQYRQRKEHKLQEWLDYCSFIKSLPYSEFITLEDENKK